MQRSQVVGQLQRRLRRHLTSATPRKKVGFAKPFQKPEEILQDAQVQTILQAANVEVDSRLANNSDKISLMAHLSEKYDEPIPSNVLGDFQTPNDIAQWYSKRLRPIGARPHARKFISNVLSNPDNSNAIDDRIDLDREAIESELLSEVPDNLSLDPKMFRPSYPEGLKTRPSKVKLKHLQVRKGAKRKYERTGK